MEVRRLDTTQPKRGRGRPRGSDRERAHMTLPADVLDLLEQYRATFGLSGRTAAVVELVRRFVPRRLKAAARLQES